MKWLCILALAIVFGAAALAQTALPSSDSNAQALIRKSKSVLEAMKAKDPQTLNGLLAQNFHSVNLAGEVDNRQEMLGAAHEGFMKDFLFYNPEVLRIDNDSAVVSYETAVTLSDQALKDLAEDNLTWPRYSRVSDLWVRHEGDWKLEFEQITPIRAMY
jgi:hypothetical protein